MLTDTQEGRLLINEVAYAIIAEKSSQELPLYVAARDRYFADPEGFLEAQESEDEALGFGTGGIMETFTVVVFPVLTPMLTLLVNETVKILGQASGESAIEWVRNLLNNKQTAKKPDFTTQQLAAIKIELDALANSEARRLGLKKSEVQRVRDALLARLAVATG